MQGGLISIFLPDASDSEQHEEEEWKNGQSFHSCKASILTKALPLIVGRAIRKSTVETRLVTPITIGCWRNPSAHW